MKGMSFIVLKDYGDIKGDKGEELVKKVLEEYGGFLFNNYTFYSRRTSVQVDHILILRSGLYIVETKNWSGRIVGEEWADNWTLYNGSKKVMYNPVVQNFLHIERLKDRLRDFVSLKDLPIINVIVFPTREAKIEVQNEENYKKIPTNPVLSLGRLRRYLRIRQDLYKDSPLITQQQAKKLKEVLEKDIYTFIDKGEHLANVKFYRRKTK
jgi:hypothetical protein